LRASRSSTTTAVDAESLSASVKVRPATRRVRIASK
jgi:hypothetical protein